MSCNLFDKCSAQKCLSHRSCMRIKIGKIKLPSCLQAQVLIALARCSADRNSCGLVRSPRFCCCGGQNSHLAPSIICWKSFPAKLKSRASGALVVSKCFSPTNPSLFCRQLGNGMVMRWDPMTGITMPRAWTSTVQPAFCSQPVSVVEYPNAERGFASCLRLVLHVLLHMGANSCVLFAPDCSSWGIPARGTSLRSEINFGGNRALKWIQGANKMVSRTLGYILQAYGGPSS